MNILIVDDSKAIHAFMKATFRGTDHTLAHAYDGQEALDLITSSDAVFDLVLLDWEMPVLSGIETLEKMVEMKITAKIIMVTSKNSMSDISTVLKAGAAEYVMKPFTKEILFDKIIDVTGKEVA